MIGNINEFILNYFKVLIFIIILSIIIIIYYYNYTKNNKLKSNVNIYYFYAEWCPHCKNFKPEWIKFTKLIEDKENIKIITINDCDDSNLCNKYNIEGFPTIIFETSDKYNKYNNSLNSEKLLDYLNNLI